MQQFVGGTLYHLDRNAVTSGDPDLPYFWAQREDRTTIEDITTFAAPTASQIDFGGPPQNEIPGFQSGKYDVYVSAGIGGEKQGPAPHTRIAPIRSGRPDSPSPDREVTLEYIDDSNAILTDGGNRYTPYEIRNGDPTNEGQTVRVTRFINRPDTSVQGMFEDSNGPTAPRIVESGSVITTSSGRPALGFADGEGLDGLQDSIGTYLIVCEITSACDVSNRSGSLDETLAGYQGKVTATSSKIQAEFAGGTVLQTPYPQGERIGIVVAVERGINDGRGALTVNGSDQEAQNISPNGAGFAVGGPNASGFKLLGGLAYDGVFLSKSKREQLSGIYA